MRRAARREGERRLLGAPQRELTLTRFEAFGLEADLATNAAPPMPDVSGLRALGAADISVLDEMPLQGKWRSIIDEAGEPPT